VKITGGTFAGDGDILGFSTAGTSITASYDSTTETLTLTGSDTFAHYAQVLDTVTFFTATDNPTNFGAAPTRTITWALDDGSGASLAIGTATTTIGITASNDAPTLSSIATSATVTELGAAVTLSPNAAVADPDNQNLTSATVKVVGGTFAGDGDQIAANVGGTNITSSYNASTETLTLTGTDTLAHYQAVLDSVVFASSNFNPTNYGSNPIRVLTWTVNDGSASSAAQTETVSIVAVNNAPTLSSVTGVTSFTENGPSVTLSPSVTVTDPDNLTLVSATVSVGNGFAGDGDVLGFNTAGTSITGSYNSATETLVLSGIDTIAHYQSVLDSVTFKSTSENPTNYGSNLSRVLTWTVNDGSASSSQSAPQFTTVVVTPINDAPTLANTPTVKHSPVGHTTTIAPGASVVDPDSLTLTNATVKITGGTFAGDGDVLAANVAGTSITSSYNAATETLVLTGSDTLAHYQQVLDSVTFSSGANPTNSGANPTRTLTWVLNDGSGSNNLSTVATTTISISPLPKNDFNGDAVSELLFQDLEPSGRPSGLAGTPQIWLMSNTSVTSQAILPNPGASWTIVGTGDFNNDNDADILFRDTSSGNMKIFEMNGTLVASTVALPFPGPSWVPLGMGDFNADGTDDILFFNPTTGEVDTWFINNGQMVGGTGLGFVSTAWQYSGIGDFNGDGTDDVLWHNTATGAVETWLLGNGHLIGGTGVGSVSSAWVAAGIGDLNGDGTDDVLWRNTVNNEVDDWLMTNGHISGGAAIGFVRPTDTVVGLGDYNGDSKADVLLQAADGTPTIWTMNGNTITATTTFPTPGQNWHANTG